MNLKDSLDKEFNEYKVMLFGEKMVTRDLYIRKVDAVLRKYPLVETYFRDSIISAISAKGTNLLEIFEIPLVRYTVEDKDSIKNLEKYLEELGAIPTVSIPIRRLQENLKDAYSSVFSELSAAKRLLQMGGEDIRFLEEGRGKTPDIGCVLGGTLVFVEVKNLDELYPLMTVALDKLGAIALFDKKFRNYFIISSKYNLCEFKNVKDFKDKLSESLDKLIGELSSRFKKDNYGKFSITIDKFEFDVEIKRSDQFVLAICGKGYCIASTSDLFLDLYNVYSRFINSMGRAYKQLLSYRNGDKAAVKNDYIFINLNVGPLADIVPVQIRTVFHSIIDDVGIKKLTNIELFY